MFYALTEPRFSAELEDVLGEDRAKPVLMEFKSREERDAWMRFLDPFSRAFHVTARNAYEKRTKISRATASILIRTTKHTYIPKFPNLEYASAYALA